MHTEKKSWKISLRRLWFSQVPKSAVPHRQASHRKTQKSHSQWMTCGSGEIQILTCTPDHRSPKFKIQLPHFQNTVQCWYPTWASYPLTSLPHASCHACVHPLRRYFYSTTPPLEIFHCLSENYLTIPQKQAKVVFFHEMNSFCVLILILFYTAVWTTKIFCILCWSPKKKISNQRKFSFFVYKLLCNY